MKAKFFILSLIVASAGVTSHAMQPDSAMLFDSNEPVQILINNRILSKINGKAITVMDVVKRLDMLFYRQFPQYASSVQARHQFYQMNWKGTLQELVDKELIIADAQEVHLSVSDSDLRQEMDENFGPNIHENLEKAGITIDEAKELLQNEILLRRMMMIRVNSKAYSKVTPQKVREAFEQYAIENAIPEEWLYYVVSIRDENEERGAETARIAYELLVKDGISIQELPAKMVNLDLIDENTRLTVSDRFTHNEKEISEAYREPLNTVVPGTYSEPVAQLSRADQSTVHRVFFLEEVVPGTMPTFEESEVIVENFLMSKAVTKETKKYLQKLRGHHKIEEEDLTQRIPEDFEPFELS